MPKRMTGRPKGGDGDAGTRQVRVNADLGEMLGWIYEIEGEKSAVILDPLIRATITGRYKRIEATVEKIKKRRAEEEKIKREALEQLRRQGPG